MAESTELLTMMGKDTSGRHPLLEKGTFQQLHRNEIIETRPQTLHFGGFQVHQEHTHTLRILNISARSLRVAIIGPSTPFFRIGYDKKGLLAPGMSEEITVTFTPHEWRYYYDTIKIFCGDLAENLVVPIHAYPSANDIKLPRILDFGRVAVGTSRTKVIPLSCTVPIQFEFEITVLEAHPDFQIAPLAGVIPPDGTTNVVVTFLPTRHRTSRTELQFSIAQFDFDPVTVTVVGSCSPDIMREEVLRTAGAELEAETAQQIQDSMTSAAARLKEKQGRGPLEVKAPVFPEPPGDRLIEGVKVPTTKLSTQNTNFVLNQTAGKLPLKDLFSFIKEQREAAESRRRKAETGREQGGSVESEADEDDKQALMLRFEMEYREVEKYDKVKELNSVVALGEDQLSTEDVSQGEDARRRRHQRLLDGKMEADTARHEPVLKQEKVPVPNNYKPALKPQWDENANDTFSVRLQVIDRFVRAGAKCLMRVRAQRRIEVLREALRAASVTDRTSCRTWVEIENKAAASGTKGAQPGAGKEGEGEAAAATSGDDDTDKLDIIHIPSEFILPLQFPIAVSSLNQEERTAVDVAPLDNFEEFKAVPINVRLDYKVLQYEKHDVPPPAAYMRPHSERSRFHAALEEHLVRGPRGDACDGAEMPLTMPDSCLLPPAHDALSLLVPSPECRTYVALPEATECDPEYRLAQAAPLLRPLQAEPLLPPNIMSIETPWLESWRQTRQIADPFQYFDPMPGCFAEAGGPMGPRLGCDAGGERLAFLPVGGYSRDLPEDTTDDEAEDFHIPPPGGDAYKEALEGTDGPLASVLWRKQLAAEERLRTMCASNGRAVRDRLNDLNKDLDHRNKLYLG